MTTINDIAKKAGVAKSTVSNVFSKKKYVSPEICERVMKICKELDFEMIYIIELPPLKAKLLKWCILT